MRDVRQIGRRTWLARMGGGLVALWASLDFGRGSEGWSILLGRLAHAQQPPGPAMPVAPYIPVEIDIPNSEFTVQAFVVVRGGEVTIVDSLLPGNAERIGRAIQSARLGWDAVRHVILTHYHGDHAGSADAIASLVPSATTFWAGAADIPQITLSRPIQPAGDGAEVFGLQIVATPGHTPGHVSVLDPATGSLFTGDAVFNLGGTLQPIYAPSTADPSQAMESVRKLGGLTFDRLLFAHGPAIERDGPALLRGLVAGGLPSPAEQQALAAALAGCCGQG